MDSERAGQQRSGGKNNNCKCRDSPIFMIQHCSTLCKISNYSSVTAVFSKMKRRNWDDPVV
jgi:hypothetical protein